MPRSEHVFPTTTGSGVASKREFPTTISIEESTFESNESDSSDEAFGDYWNATTQAEGQWTSCFKCEKLGNMFVVCEYSIEDVSGNYEKKRIMIGPHWSTLLMTFGILLVITGLVYGIILPVDEHPLLFFVGMGLSDLMFTFLALTAFSDPGIFTRHTRPLGEDWTYSGQAGSFRPPGTIFCKETELLIQGYDHFCVWTGTVIGEKNIAWFNLYVAALFATLLFDMGKRKPCQ